MKRGGKREGAGRKPGSKTKKTAEIALRAAQEGITPLEYMLNVLRAPIPPELEGRLDEKIDVDVLAALSNWHNKRLDAAKAAAPYVHPRLANIEHTGKDGGPIQTDMGEKELARRLAFVIASGTHDECLTH